MISKLLRSFALLICGMLAMAAGTAHAASATFVTGAIAEYENTANQNFNSTSFAELGISSIVMSQAGARWGLQGNDAKVEMTINFTGGGSYSFNGILNWQLNASGTIPVVYFGVLPDPVTSQVPDSSDNFAAFRRSSTSKKTYILVLPSQSVSFPTLLSNDRTDGSANLKLADIYAALNAEPAFQPPPPPNSAPVFTGTAPGGASPGYTFEYLEGVIYDRTVLGAVAASDADGDSLTFEIIGNVQDGSSNDMFAIDPKTGAITLTSAGLGTLISPAFTNDFEAQSNSQL